MKPFSPVDAIGPAFRRAREVMAMPFRLGFFLKIALVGALTQPAFYSMVISYPLQAVQIAAGSVMGHRQTALPSASNFASGTGAAAGVLLASIAAMGLVGIAAWVLITYLFCRLRFTLFDLVVYKRGRVHEAWSKYGKQTWRYFGVVLLASFVFLIVIAVTTGPFFIRMLGAFKNIGAQGASANPNPWPLFAQMLPLMGILFLLGLAWIVVDAVLQDFILPPMAIENAPIEGAFGRFRSLLRDEPGSMLVYLLLRFVIALGISWVLMFAVLIALLIVGAGGLAVGVGLYHVMWQGSMGMRVVFVAIAVAMALVLLAIYLFALTVVYGITAAFKQSYAAYFFGSRYPQLGDQIEPLPRPILGDIRIDPPLPPIAPLQDPPRVW